MVESFINQVGGDCVLIVEDLENFRRQNFIRPEPKLIEIPHIIHGNVLQNFIALISILKINHKIKSLSVVGADIVDGAYSIRLSINRLFLLRVINSLQINSRITGFSWSDNANPRLSRLIRIISKETQLCVRDPQSAQRLRDKKVVRISEVTDLVFSDDTQAGSPLVDRWISSSTKPVAVVNISGLGVQEGEQYRNHIQEYGQIVNFLHTKGFRILILPHVFRVESGDLEVSNDLFVEYCSSEDLSISEPLSPAQERRLFKNVDFVITGRMHIAILALSVGRPVIALETMGKVQGLFELFNIAGYCIDSNVTFAKKVIDAITRLDKEYPSVCKAIEHTMPEIRQKSLLNFAGLV